MEAIKLADLTLSQEESRDITEFLAKKRNIKNYERKSDNKLFRAIKKCNQNRKRIDIIREELKDSSYKPSRSELKEIKKNLYNIEKRKKLESKKTERYLDELDKKILKLDKYHYHDDYKGIKDIQNLFKIIN